MNTGGVEAQTPEVATALVDTACNLADELNVRYLELRHEVPVDHPKLNHDRTDKFHMRLELPDTDAELDKTFKSKLRSQIKKCGTYNHTTSWGGLELLLLLPCVCNQHRDRNSCFLKETVQIHCEFIQWRSRVLCHSQQGTAVAAALLVHSHGTTSAQRKKRQTWNRTGPNMWMYRQLLERAITKVTHSTSDEYDVQQRQIQETMGPQPILRFGSTM